MTRNLYTNVKLKATPVDDEHLVNKKYVDQAINKKVTDPVRVATTGSEKNISLNPAADPLTIDGVTLDAGDRVLVLNQDNGLDNGIYVLVDDGTDRKLVRAEGFEDGDMVNPNIMVHVMEGTVNGDVTFVSTNDSKAEIGSDPIEFTRLNDSVYVTSAKFEFAGEWDEANQTGNKTTDFVITHNIGTEDVQVSVYEKGTKEECQFDVSVIDDKSISIHADVILTVDDEFVAIVQG